jgi:hypothetical protein
MLMMLLLVLVLLVLLVLMVLLARIGIGWVSLLARVVLDHHASSFSSTLISEKSNNQSFLSFS